MLNNQVRKTTLSIGRDSRRGSTSGRAQTGGKIKAKMKSYFYLVFRTVFMISLMLPAALSVGSVGPADISATIVETGR
jgi:hypothetical protein